MKGWHFKIKIYTNLLSSRDKKHYYQFPASLKSVVPIYHNNTFIFQKPNMFRTKSWIANFLEKKLYKCRYIDKRNGEFQMNK